MGITKEGRWLYTEATAEQMADGSWEELPGNMACVISPDRADHGMILFTPDGRVEKMHLDVVIPVLHGLWGEDGTVQGLLELAGIAYVGCGVLASSVCMDKAVANALFEANGVPHTKWVAANRWEIEKDLEGVCAGVEQKLGWPVFVKPANAGSSVGISKVSNQEELKAAIALALENDRKVVFEAFVDGQEVECAVIGSDPAVATRPGEILAGAEFYTYDDKYKNGVSQTVIPAHLPEAKLDEVKTKAMKTFLDSIQAGKSVVITPEVEQNVVLSARNIPGVVTTTAKILSVYDIVNANQLVIDKAALAIIEEVFA
mgnify:CR=1 FL=1